MKLKDVKVDEEIRKRFKPLGEEQFVLLKKDIEERGCLSPLAVWKEEGVLLDGHHRRAACLALKVEPKLRMVSFEDRDAALAWIDRLQAARRNLSRKEVDAIVAREYSAALEKAKERAAKKTGKKKGRPALKKEATEIAAKTTGIPEKEIEKSVEAGRKRDLRATNKKDMSVKIPRGMVKIVAIIPKRLRSRIMRAARTRFSGNVGRLLDALPLSVPLEHVAVLTQEEHDHLTAMGAPRKENVREALRRLITEAWATFSSPPPKGKERIVADVLEDTADVLRRAQKELGKDPGATIDGLLSDVRSYKIRLAAKEEEV